jgi:hypothetical protein
MSKAAATASGQQWYRTLNATQWKTLLASNLGWVFDGFETFALILTVGVALRQLLDPSEYTQIPSYAGAIIAMHRLGAGRHDRRDSRRLHRAQTHHDPSDPNVFNNDRARSAASGVASAAKFKSPATTVRTAPRQRAVPKSSTKPAIHHIPDAAAIDRNSFVSRVLPIPASPRIRRAVPAVPLTHASRTARNWPSSDRRPTNG